MAMKWFRVYSETFSDLKLRKVARQVDLPLVSVIGIWLALLSLASESPDRGKLLIGSCTPVTLDDINEYAGCNVSETLQHFIAIGIVTQDATGIYAIPSWDKRQYTSDDSTARVKASRERKKPRSAANLADCNVSETLQSRSSNDPQTTDTDPDPETTTTTTVMVTASAPAPEPTAPAATDAAPTDTQTLGAQRTAVFACWQDNMPGTLTPILAEQIDDWIAEYTAAEVLRGIRAAIDANVRKPSYINGFLRRRAAGEDKPRLTPTAPGAYKEQEEKRARLQAEVKRARQGIATAKRLGFAPPANDVAVLERAKKAGIEL
jgi:hypothetical protein